ncbi:hypothetical protein ACF3DV_23960 [Chlorogloeopsis fritschii PCC 9212]|uniref:Uncharacterized protein n=1 Tax=Chlorogloeopsis fritschii PCC 6912 TaxID=211165 RepID=A0A433NQ21_CHLFR|nr:hypothetical protein [Chlorogloeopsis fritschii]RUR85879.1 hypothetical protein PCC6912_07040 [Chlorogloeopsis fritschii PCC 6912]
MDFEKRLIQDLASETNLNQATQSEIKADDIRLDGANVPETGLFATGAAIGFILMWTGFLAIFSKMRTLREELGEDNKFFFSLCQSQQHPCKTCQYFSHNYHLQCAVQPSLVLTEEARNCTDFHPKRSRLFNKHN